MLSTTIGHSAPKRLTGEIDPLRTVAFLRSRRGPRERPPRRGAPRASQRQRQLRSRRLPRTGPVAANVRSVPARKSYEKRADQPFAAKNRPLTRTTKPPNAQVRAIEMPILYSIV
jgi:hypothetical protein